MTQLRTLNNKPGAPRNGEIHLWRTDIESHAEARAARAEILAAYLGGPEAAEIAPGEEGKPDLAQAPERLSFNLSHSGRLALLAIAAGGVEVGVDIELVKPRRDLVRLAQRWLPEVDAAMVAGAPAAERETRFYAAWTRHESRVKCTGAGLAGPPPDPEIVAFDIAIGEGYAAAVAIDTVAAGTAEPRVTRNTFRP